MSSAAEDILCEPHVDRELSDDDNGPGATSRPQSHGGQNKDPCWALVQCIPIKSPDNTMKTNVVCNRRHVEGGSELGNMCFKIKFDIDRLVMQMEILLYFTKRSDIFLSTSCFSIM